MQHRSCAAFLQHSYSTRFMCGRRLKFVFVRNCVSLRFSIFVWCSSKQRLVPSVKRSIYLFQSVRSFYFRTLRYMNTMNRSGVCYCQVEKYFCSFFSHRLITVLQCPPDAWHRPLALSSARRFRLEIVVSEHETHRQFKITAFA